MLKDLEQIKNAVAAFSDEKYGKDRSYEAPLIKLHEEVEETLNIMDKEKELIIKALKKHKGKRKDAASDLGISERTLYRKLKEYDIDE